MRSFATHLSDYLQRLWKFAVVDNSWFVAVIGVTAAIWISAANAHLLLPLDPEEEWQLAGVMFEVAGIGVVIRSLQDIQRLFGRPLLGSAGRKFLAAWPRWKQAGHAVTGALASATVSLGARAAGEVTHSPGATLQERIFSLENQLANLNKAVFAKLHGIDDRLADLDKSLTAEQRSREEQQRATRQFIDEAIAGGIALEGVGLIWLILGLILSNYPEGLARFVSPVLQ